MGIWDNLKNVLNIGGNDVQIEPTIIGNNNYQVPDSRLKMGLANLKNAKNFLFDKIGGFTDKVGDKVENAMFGKLVEPTIETTQIKDNDGNLTIESGVGTPTRQGGFINDLIGGFRENRDNAFMPTNLMADKNKGFVYRLGEGLGSLARIGESPLGRGILVGGAVSALGGSGGDALAYGLGTSAQNQQLRGADRLYRDSLIKAEQDSLIAERDNLLNDENFKKLPTDTQQQYLSNISDRIDAVANRYNNVRGYISPQSYNAMLQAKQLQDNAEWRKAHLLTQQAQQKALEDLNREKFEYQKQQDKIQNAQNWAKINASNKKNLSKEEAKREKSLSTLKMINSAINTVENNPNAFGFFKGIAPNDITNRADAEGVQARAVVESVTAEYRKYLTGAQMSDKERKDYEKFLPNSRDNSDIIIKKLNGMLSVIQAREGFFNDEIQTNPNTVQSSTYQEGQTATHPQTGQKIIYRGGKWQTL